MDKTWIDVLIQVIETLMSVVITTLLPYLFVMLRAKVKNDKAAEYLKRAETYLTSAVAMVNQTFVDELKKDGKFDMQAQTDAFKMAFDAWLDMMNDEMKDVITAEVGNFAEWAETKIEAKVNELKK